MHHLSRRPPERPSPAGFVVRVRRGPYWLGGCGGGGRVVGLGVPVGAGAHDLPPLRKLTPLLQNVVPGDETQVGGNAH